MYMPPNACVEMCGGFYDLIPGKKFCSGSPHAEEHAGLVQTDSVFFLSVGIHRVLCLAQVLSMCVCL